MLALFHKGLGLPPGLNEFEHIFVEKAQTPMAFSTLTEDETVSCLYFIYLSIGEGGSKV